MSSAFGEQHQETLKSIASGDLPTEEALANLEGQMKQIHSKQEFLTRVDLQEARRKLRNAVELGEKNLRDRDTGAPDVARQISIARLQSLRKSIEESEQQDSVIDSVVGPGLRAGIELVTNPRNADVDAHGFAKLGGLLLTAWGGVRTLFSGGSRGFFTFLSGIGLSFYDRMGSVGQFLTSTASTVAPFLRDGLNTARGGLADILDFVAEHVPTSVGNFLRPIARFVRPQPAAEEVKKKAEEEKKKVEEAGKKKEETEKKVKEEGEKKTKEEGEKKVKEEETKKKEELEKKVKEEGEKKAKEAVATPEFANFRAFLESLPNGSVLTNMPPRIRIGANTFSRVGSDLQFNGRKLHARLLGSDVDFSAINKTGSNVTLNGNSRTVEEMGKIFSDAIPYLARGEQYSMMLGAFRIQDRPF